MNTTTAKLTAAGMTQSEIARAEGYLLNPDSVTVRQQRSILFDVADQDGESPFSFTDVNGFSLLFDNSGHPETARQQRQALFNFDGDQDEVSPWIISVN